MRARMLLLAAAVVLTGAGCSGTIDATGDSGPQQSEDRTITAASRVELATPGTLVVTTGDTPSLRVTAGKDVIGELTNEAEDGVLTLDTARSVDEFGDVRYELVLPSLEELTVTGSGTITVAGSADSLAVLLEGSGNYDGTGLEGERSEVTVAGSGRADVGRTGTLVAVVEGSGTITHDRGTEVDSRIDGTGHVDAR